MCPRGAVKFRINPQFAICLQVADVVSLRCSPANPPHDLTLLLQPALAPRPNRQPGILVRDQPGFTFEVCSYGL